MKIQPFSILGLALLALLPQGISGGLYGAGAAEMAGALGLSVDEASWFKTLNMFGQLCTLPLAAWLTYRAGKKFVFRLGAIIGLISALVSSLWMAPVAQMVAWLGHGVSASLLLIFAHGMVLRNLSFRAIALVEGALLLSAVLIPLSLYPYALAHLAENNLWHWAFAIQVLPFLMMLLFARFGQWPVPDSTQKIEFNWLQALLFCGFICGVTFLLLRGERYNWFREPMLVELAGLTLMLGIATVVVMKKKWGRGEFIRTAALRSRHGKVSMLDAAVAGFAILGTTLLISTYVTKVLHYNHQQLGQLEIIGFAGMIGGLIISVIMTSSHKLNPDKVVPIGILMMVTACALLTGSNASSGIDDLWLPILIKGFAIGLLNITLTIHILRAFPKRYVIEAIAWFFLFRNLGSMIAIAEFSSLMSYETTNAMAKLAENFNIVNETFVQYQQSTMQMLQHNGHTNVNDSSAMLLMAKLKTQALSVAGVNNFQWFIFSVVMILLVKVPAMKWAKKKAAQELPA